MESQPRGLNFCQVYVLLLKDLRYFIKLGGQIVSCILRGSAVDYSKRKMVKISHFLLKTFKEI